MSPEPTDKGPAVEDINDLPGFCPDSYCPKCVCPKCPDTNGVDDVTQLPGYCPDDPAKKAESPAIPVKASSKKKK